MKILIFMVNVTDIFCMLLLLIFKYIHTY
jgi:hypothetical protein